LVGSFVKSKGMVKTRGKGLKKNAYEGIKWSVRLRYLCDFTYNAWNKKMFTT
jgi:hypothetical protein